MRCALADASPVRDDAPACRHLHYERRSDLDPSNIRTAYRCLDCERLGYVNLKLKIRRIKWSNDRGTFRADERARDRVAVEQQWTKEGWRP